MEYTYQEKCVAAIECKLWWRFPEALGAGSQNWTLITDDLISIESKDLRKPGVEYYIGDEPPKPPRVLSELERELLEALEEADKDFAREGFGIDGPYRAPIRAAIAKAKGEA